MIKSFADYLREHYGEDTVLVDEAPETPDLISYAQYILSLALEN